MRLKFLIGPFFALLALIIGIGFVQPDWTVYQEKQIQFVEKENQTNNLDTLNSNIQSLGSALNGKKDLEEFASHYLPGGFDESSVVDALNFSAAQTGVLVDSLEFSENIESSLLSKPVAADSSLATASPAVNSDGTPATVAKKRVPVIKAFMATIVVRGRYENIKNYFDRVARMNRLTTITSFAIKKGDVVNKNSQEEILSSLTGVMNVNFDYVVAQKIGSAFNEGVFLNSQFDTSDLTKVMNWATNNVPDLVKPTTGKANPFQ